EVDRFAGSLYHQVRRQRIKTVRDWFAFILHCFPSLLAQQPPRLRRGSGKLGRIFFRALLDRTFLGDRTDFDNRAVLKTRALFRDLDRFVLVGDREIEITADRFLRFRKRTVSDSALFSRNNFAFVFQRMTAYALSLFFQPLEPSHPVRHHFLKLSRRESSVPDIAAKKQ